jgi:archaellum component FlaC
MTESKDMIVPMLREIRADINDGFSKVNDRLDKQETRLDRIEGRQKSFSQALAGDSFMSKMLVGDWEERIEALEKKIKKLEAAK